MLKGNNGAVLELMKSGAYVIAYDKVCLRLMKHATAILPFSLMNFNTIITFHQPDMIPHSVICRFCFQCKVLFDLPDFNNRKSHTQAQTSSRVYI